VNLRNLVIEAANLFLGLVRQSLGFISIIAGLMFIYMLNQKNLTIRGLIVGILPLLITISLIGLEFFRFATRKSRHIKIINKKIASMGGELISIVNTQSYTTSRYMPKVKYTIKYKIKGVKRTAKVIFDEFSLVPLPATWSLDIE
jgi:hypothetical protein